MKKITLLAAALFMLTAAFSQSEKYQAKMKELVPKMDSMNSGDVWTDMANTFERVGDVEKTQWLPYYYGALCNIMSANMKTAGKMGGTSDITDPAADKADALLTKALALTKENSETFCIKKMIATTRMMGDPMSRYMQYGPMAAEALEKAREMNPDNPRVYLLEGQDKFFTPEQFGGSKAEAKTLFEKAIALYGSFKPESELHPVWGQGQVHYFHSQIK
jgi:hypothetical protein